MPTPLPLILLLAAAPAPDAPAPPRKSCTDTVPKECAKVQFLGDEGDCSCFVCNPGTKSRKVVCTNDDATKRALRKLVEDAPAEKTSAPAGAAR
jgi:hypothetical protein